MDSRHAAVDEAGQADGAPRGAVAVEACLKVYGASGRRVPHAFAADPETRVLRCAFCGRRTTRDKILTRPDGSIIGIPGEEKLHDILVWTTAAERGPTA